MGVYGMGGWPPKKIVEVDVPGVPLALTHAPPHEHDAWAPVAAATVGTTTAGSLLGESRDVMYAAPVAWVPRSTVFTGTFRLSATNKGRGRAVVFEEEDGRSFPMFLLEFVPLVVGDLLGPKGTLTGGLCIVRHGSRYGTKFVG